MWIICTSLQAAKMWWNCTALPKNITVRPAVKTTQKNILRISQTLCQNVQYAAVL
jgi:hypothetical protein